MMRWISAVLVVTAVGAAAANDVLVPQTSRIKLRPQASARADAATFANVLDLSQADPLLVEAIGEKSVFAVPPAYGTVELSHDQIVARLASLGVNRARVLVHGALVCHVTIEPANSDIEVLSEHPEARAAMGAPLVRPAATPDGRTATLADVVKSRLRHELASDGGDVDVQFERGSEQYVALTTPPYDFVVRSVGKDKLGMRELRVLIRREKQAQRTVPLFVNVRLVKPVVVAREPLNVGATVHPEDVMLEKRVFDETEETGFDSPSVVIGQQVKRYVAPGAMVGRQDLTAVDLVRRSRPVTLLGGAGGVSAQLTGVALESGSFGETVRVRIGSMHKSRRELRGVVTGVGTVRIIQQ